MSARKGLKFYGERAADVIVTEFKQLHDQEVFEPIKWNSLTSLQRKGVLRAITLIKEKRSGKIKGRTVADGRPRRDMAEVGEASSPTVFIEAMMLSCVIDAIEEHDVATCDISGAFIQADINDFVTVKFEREMVDLLVATDPIYERYVHITIIGHKVLYVKLKKALYEILMAAKLFFLNLTDFLKTIGFVINQYELCAYTKTIEGTTCTIINHVDDLKISHVSSKVVDDVIAKLEVKYGKMNVVRGKEHIYVGIKIINNNDRSVSFDMKEYIKETIDEFHEDLSKKITSPAALYLFDINDSCDAIEDEKARLFHRLVTKMLFVSNRGRPEIQVAVAFLCTRTKQPDQDDWKKLRRMLQYLNSTINMVLTLSGDGMTVIKWWVGASFSVHNNMRSHTGGYLSFGRGMVKCKSTKQKLNTKSSTEAGLIGLSDMSMQVL